MTRSTTERSVRTAGVGTSPPQGCLKNRDVRRVNASWRTPSGDSSRSAAGLGSARVRVDSSSSTTELVKLAPRDK